jgi:hypothetical protein
MSGTELSTGNTMTYFFRETNSYSEKVQQRIAGTM